MVRTFRLITAALALVAIGAMSFSTLSNAAAKANSAGASPNATVRFRMVRSSGAQTANCIAGASAVVTITKTTGNDLMTVQASGLPHNTGFDLFVIELPNAPFGVSWYQSDLHTGSNGTGSATVRGIFNRETFSVSLGDSQNPSVVFPPTHQLHLGLWFNSPAEAQAAGCPNTQTVFNGTQNAGIQALSTQNFPDTAGPLGLVAP